jgi:RNA polymerase sigma factor (sigma-70 family)
MSRGSAARNCTNLHELSTLEDLADSFDADGPEKSADEQQALRRLMETVQGLKPFDKQVMILYLEDLDAVEIGEVTGLTPGAVSTKVHRIKALIAKRLQPVGAPHVT